MEQIECTVVYTMFRSADNGYSVLKCETKGQPFTAVGTMPAVTDGASLVLEGEWIIHPKYGDQFQASRFEEILPVTKQGIEKFLGSGRIKGISEVSAKQIVRMFGTATFDVIEHHPEKLLEVRGIGKVRLEKIKASWTAQKELKYIMAFLQGMNVSPGIAVKIHNLYGANSVNIVKENPYRLADEVRGIGFKTADEIAMGLGFKKNCYFRLKSGIIYTLNEISNQGHCYASWKQLAETAGTLLETETPEIEITICHMVKEGLLIREEEEDAVYLPAMYYSELGVVRRIKKLISSPIQMNFQTDAIVSKISGSLGIQYNETQLEAIKTALTTNVMVLTGGPGTGKTTTTLGIIHALQMSGRDVLLAAPTGRASKRLSEATGMHASTIHRLLEFKPNGTFSHNADNPLEGGALVVDECSMVDIVLMNNLIKAVPSGMKLILVGDTDQLPSVGAGDVLRDIIKSGQLPVIRLTEIFRQAAGSRIITNAHRINNGQKIDISGGADSDFFFARADTGLDPEAPDYRETLNSRIAALIKRFCTKNLPVYYRADPIKDIQVLAPSRKGLCGTESLNKLLQDGLNPEKLCLKRIDTEYRLGDKVIQICNNYDKGVFNGDIGTICFVNPEDKELSVNFDGQEVGYDIGELDELELAYAITIHKSQGSEYPIVVIPLTMSNYIMLSRNLLYTGVTRAKKILVLIGEQRALNRAIRNKSASVRNTRLAERLVEEKNDAEASEVTLVRQEENPVAS